MAAAKISKRAEKFITPPYRFICGHGRDMFDVHRFARDDCAAQGIQFSLFAVHADAVFAQASEQGSSSRRSAGDRAASRFDSDRNADYLITTLKDGD